MTRPQASVTRWDPVHVTATVQVQQFEFHVRRYCLLHSDISGSCWLASTAFIILGAQFPGYPIFHPQQYMQVDFIFCKFFMQFLLLVFLKNFSIHHCKKKEKKMWFSTIYQLYTDSECIWVCGSNLQTLGARGRYTDARTSSSIYKRERDLKY